MIRSYQSNNGLRFSHMEHDNLHSAYLDLSERARNIAKRQTSLGRKKIWQRFSHRLAALAEEGALVSPIIAPDDREWHLEET